MSQPRVPAMAGARRLIRAAALLLALAVAPVSLWAEQPAGDARWPQAVALMRAGQPDDAIPLLDALVSAHPDNSGYRLELAYALLQTKRYTRARFHAERVALAAATPQERIAAQRILGAADRQRTLSGYLRFDIVPESNPGRQTAASSVTVQGLDFTLNDDAKAEPSTSYILATGGIWAPKLRDGLHLRLGADLWARHNEDERLRDVIFSARAGLLWLSPEGRRFGVDALAGRNWNAGEPVDDTSGLRIEAATPLGAQTHATLVAHRIWLDSLDGTGDEIDDKLTLGVSGGLGQGVVARGALTLARRNTAFDHLDWSETAVSVGLEKSFRGGLVIGGDLTAARRGYGGRDPLFADTREDDRLRLDLRVYDRDFRIGPFVPMLRLGVERNRSTIEFNDYDNEYLSVGVTRSF